MPWFKVDDKFHSHPKIVEVSLEAVGLWTLAGSWCAAHLTDGIIGRHALERLGGSTELADDLVGAGLWFTISKGWEFNDWAVYQPTRDDVEADRKKERDRKAEYRRNKAGQYEGQTKEALGASGGLSRRLSQGDTGGESRGVSARPDPTRPDPTITTSNEVVMIVAERADVDQLCSLLADLIEANGSLRPTIGKGWLDAARLLLDKDGRDLAAAERLMRWVQEDSFWKSTILSMGKFREKYDQLRLAANREREQRTTGTTSGRPSKADRARGVMEQGRRMQEEIDRKAIA